MSSESSTDTGQPADRDSYKWVALSNTTLAALLGSINASSVLLALPVIFRGIEINPLAPAVILLYLRHAISTVRRCIWLDSIAIAGFGATSQIEHARLLR